MPLCSPTEIPNSLPNLGFLTFCLPGELQWIQKCDSEFLANFLGGNKPAFKNIYRINEVIRTLKCYYLGNIIWEMGGQGGLAYCSPWGRKESGVLSTCMLQGKSWKFLAAVLLTSLLSLFFSRYQIDLLIFLSVSAM